MCIFYSNLGCYNLRYQIDIERVINKIRNLKQSYSTQNLKKNKIRLYTTKFKYKFLIWLFCTVLRFIFIFYKLFFPNVWKYIDLRIIFE